MEASVITLLFLLFAVVMFVWEKIPLGVTSMIVCIGLVVTGVLDWKTVRCLRQGWQIKSEAWSHTSPNQRNS